MANGGTANVSDRVARLETAVTNIDGRLDHIDRTLGQIASANKTNWGVVGTIAGVFVAGAVWFNSLVTDPILQTQERHEQALTRIAAAFHEHVRDGHPRRVEAKTIHNRESIAVIENWMRDREPIPERIRALERVVFDGKEGRKIAD